jgi:NadR type nicotinamide-nucleotide adenylyltransferase
MTTGFLLGKFMPPHAGHVYLGSFAESYCDRLTILACSLPGDPIPGDLRFRWMKALFPKARVVHLSESTPQEPAEHPDFWAIWKAHCRRAHPEPIDFVFASESYGHRLAQEVGARFVPVDPDREATPVSARLIRSDPHRHWHFIPGVVRPYYLKRICLFGPESTGKTTLARQLAAHFATCHVPEYGRIYTDRFGTACTADDLVAIARGHTASTAAALQHARRYLFLDTDPLLTALWAEMLLGKRVPALDAFRDHADLYLLCDIDIPWVDDGSRYFQDMASRGRFFDICRRELDERSLPFAVISGPDRLGSAISAIGRAFPAA